MTTPSTRIRERAESRFRLRVAGRNLSELKQADLLNAELIVSILEYIEGSRNS